MFTNNLLHGDSDDEDLELRLMSFSFNEAPYQPYQDYNGTQPQKKTCQSLIAKGTRREVPSICQSAPLIGFGRSMTRNRARHLYNNKEDPNLSPLPSVPMTQCISAVANDVRSSPGSKGLQKRADGIRILSITNKQQLMLTYQPKTSLNSSFPSIYNDGIKNKSIYKKPFQSQFMDKKNEHINAVGKNEENESTDDDPCDENSFSMQRSTTSKIKPLLLVILFISLVVIALDYSFFSQNDELDSKIQMDKLSNGVLSGINSTLYGQHIAIHALERHFPHSLTDENIKVITLLLVGPSGSGKSFTRKILEDIIADKFAVSRCSTDHLQLQLNETCMELSHRNYQNLAIILEDIDYDMQSALKAEDFIFGSRHCLRFNKVLIITVSSVFSEKIKQFMFSQCKFGDERLSINSDDVMDYITQNSKDSLKIESSYERHRVIPMIFLPLDVDHVKMCILKELSSHGIAKEKWSSITRRVISEMDFHPQCDMRYSESGCKLVSSRVDYIIDKYL